MMVPSRCMDCSHSQLDRRRQPPMHRSATMLGQNGLDAMLDATGNLLMIGTLSDENRAQ